MNQLCYLLPNRINDLSTLLALRKVNQKFRDCVDKVFINQIIKCNKIFLIILLLKHSPANTLNRINTIISNVKGTWKDYFDILRLLERCSIPEPILILIINKYKHVYSCNYAIMPLSQDLFIHMCKHQQLTYNILYSYRANFKYQKIHKQKHLHQYLFDSEIYQYCQYTTKWNKISPPQTYTIQDLLITLIFFTIFSFVFFFYFLLFTFS